MVRNTVIVWDIVTQSTFLYNADKLIIIIYLKICYATLKLNTHSIIPIAIPGMDSIWGR